jgi:hypothetical protein
MKTLFLWLILGVMQVPSTAATEKVLSPYLEIGRTQSTLSLVATQIKTNLKSAGFEILGEYSPKNQASQLVIAVTRSDLQQETLKITNRGMLAAIFKIGLIENAGEVSVSTLNPEYIFHAYLRKHYATHEPILSKIVNQYLAALKTIGSQQKAFGGEKTDKALWSYYYMWPAATQTFDDPVVLAKFSNFEEGVKIIQKNLTEKTGQTTGVFSLILNQEKIAVFGVALNHPKTGEQFFLPKIGEQNLAALPYEIILTDTQATMLHGKFRLALHWPELSMGQFMTISSTPGDIEETLTLLTRPVQTEVKK